MRSLTGDQNEDTYKSEIERMKAKVELEAIEDYYGLGHLENYLTKKILSKLWI